MRKRTIAAAIAILCAAASCTVDKNQPAAPDNRQHGQIAVAIESAPEEIVRVVAVLSRSDDSDRVLALDIDPSTHSAAGTLEDIPVGPWHLRVDALDATDAVRYRGEADVTVLAGQTVAVDLELRAISGSITIRVRWGGAPANYRLVYESAFDRGAGPEWNSTVIDTTPSGRLFIGRGRFGRDDEIRFSLEGVPAHDSLEVSLRLFIIESWDGNQVLEPGGGTVGPDIWTASVEGGPLLQRTTFSNISWLAFPQAFPGNYPGASNPFQAGASERNTLGFTFAYYPTDAVYDLTYRFAHSTDAVTLVFDTELIPGDGESWGIEALRVRARTR